ncbi:unnamed protein product [Dracunculus medinensis]|uniref:Acid phosphatase n=1 Tax=Dracunculus medinensis TaxID=318479 RepID=A0A0N4UBK1_DRAME|nr:unnamed protein product [Dracunculus medinensis]
MFFATFLIIFIANAWRHGDRAPITIYPTDVHQEDAWPNGLGELTQRGIVQQYMLGKHIRERYVEHFAPFLSPTYNHKEIYIRSTDVNRTLISAMANVAGMFSSDPYNRDRNMSNLMWTPVPIHTVELSTDYIGYYQANCKRADQLFDNIRISDEFKRMVSDNKEFVEFLTNKTGMKVDFSQIPIIYDIYKTEITHGMQQPAWLNDKVVSRLYQLSQEYISFAYGYKKPKNVELIRLRGGNLLKNLIENMETKLECLANPKEPNCQWMKYRKYQGFSVQISSNKFKHDSTMILLFASLNLEDETSKDFSIYNSAIAFETWNRTIDGLAVRVLYKRSNNNMFESVTHKIDGCSHSSKYCPLKVFMRRSKIFLPNDINKECKTK